MKKKALFIILAASLSAISCSAAAYEISFDKACDIVKRSDTTLDVKVVASYDICRLKKWDCYGAVYTVVPFSHENGKPLKLITSNTLGTGDRYTLLVSSTKVNREVFLYNLASRTFTAPPDADYYLDTNAAFQSNGTQYFREMPTSCNGAGPDCASLSTLHKSIKTAFVTVKSFYPNFVEELASCPR